MTQPNTPPTNPRKEATERLLRSLGVPVNPWLPLVEDELEVRLQTADHVAGRTIILCCVNWAAQDQDAAGAIDVLQSNGLWDWVSPNERAFLEKKNPTEEERIPASWCVEGAWVMSWALGDIPELSLPTTICDIPELIRRLPRTEHIRRFCAEATLRPVGEILDQTDRIYRIHWAVRDALLNGDDPPGGFDPGVVVERHRALNWITRYQDDWDDVTTDT